MTWFRVDDSFHGHPKVAALEEGPCFAQALALWMMAGSWSAAHLTDGLVPRAQLRRLVPYQAAKAAAELVRVGLWVEDAEGHRFHGWHDYQPTRADVLAERERNAERVRAWRDKRRTNGDGNVGCNGVTPDARTPHVTAPVMVPPTRPDPTRPDLSPSGERETPPQASEVEPSPIASHGAEAMLRSLVAPTDADAVVAALVSETRQAAGGAPFRGTGFADRQAVQKLAEWAAATSTPPDRLRAVLVAFWAAKGTTARLSWLVEEEPGRFLGKPKVRGMAPPVSHAEFGRLVAEAGGSGHATIVFE